MSEFTLNNDKKQTFRRGQTRDGTISNYNQIKTYFY